MAYLIGAASDEEIKELVTRGWTIGEPPLGLRHTPDDSSGDQMIMIYVDSDLFSIMSGPDWEK